MPAQHINDADFQSKVMESKLPVLLDFYATWCGPCKMAGPVLDTLSDELDGKVHIFKIDVDENPETPQKFGVMSIPTVILFQDGKEVARKVGFGGEQGYRTMLTQVLSV
ncbi:MAG: thioredoxin [Candidatus Pacebacteria bacterium]|nr:thioredoxin [Candidatus Paceibacterota bacterium]